MTKEMSAQSHLNVHIEQTTEPSPIDNAPKEIKLAVDLIYLLENNNVEKDVAIKALNIVLNDFQKK